MRMKPSQFPTHFHRKILLGVVCAVAGVLPFHLVSIQAKPVSVQNAAPTSPRDIADTWQGTLHAGQDLRTVIKITKDDKGGYKGVFYSLDQGAQPLNLDSVTLQGSEMKFEL